MEKLGKENQHGASRAGEFRCLGILDMGERLARGLDHSAGRHSKERTVLTENAALSNNASIVARMGRTAQGAGGLILFSLALFSIDFSFNLDA